MKKFSCLVTFLKSSSDKQHTDSTVSKRATPYVFADPQTPLRAWNRLGGLPRFPPRPSTNVTILHTCLSLEG